MANEGPNRPEAANASSPPDEPHGHGSSIDDDATEDSAGVSRRRFIALAGSGAGAAVVAGVLATRQDPGLVESSAGSSTSFNGEGAGPTTTELTGGNTSAASSATSTGGSGSTTSSEANPSSTSGDDPTATVTTEPSEVGPTPTTDPPRLVGSVAASRIVVIVIDDLNDYVGFLDGLPDTPALTPNMDALAAVGVNFTDAHCSSPACASARPAMWWGIDPTVTGIYNNSHEDWWRSATLGPGPTSGRTRQSILRRLRAAGYRTQGFGKIFHGAKENTHDPACWDSYINFGFSQPRPTAKLSDSELASHGTFGGQFEDEDFPDHQVALAAADAIRSMPEKTAIFVGIQKPHLPLVVPQKYFDRYVETYGEVVPPFFAESDLTDLPPVARSHFLPRGSIIAEVRANNEMKDLVHAYLAAVSFADDKVGIVLDALASSPYADDTTVILTSDHGFAVGEKLTLSKFQLWEQGTRVPLVLRHPAVEPGAVSSSVSHLDLAPTIEEVAGLTPVPYGEGLSLLGPIREPARHDDRVVLSSYMAERSSGDVIGVAARDRNYSFIKYFVSQADRRELYDRRSDRLELENLAGSENQAIMDRLESFLPQRPAVAISG